MYNKKLILLTSVVLVLFLSGYLIFDKESNIESKKGKIVNNSTILNTHMVNSSHIDGGLSAHGYVKFIEKPEKNSLVIRQTYVNLSCKSSEMVIRPNSGTIQDKSIKAKIKPKNNSIAKKCLGSINNIVPPTGKEIKFKSLNKGQKIKFIYDGIKFSYVTKGEKSTNVREITIPDNIQT